MSLKIIIPIYKKDLTDLEFISLERATKILHNHPLIVIKPYSLDLSSLQKQYSNLKFEEFDDLFFQGIAGYNRLMLSSEFYNRFIDSEYILIYQLDAYVFIDNLSEWCNKGYDYIGAPWVKRSFYNFFPVNLYMYIERVLFKGLNLKSRQDLFNKVGNGGLSLRNVNKHYQATLVYKQEIDLFLRNTNNHLYNEDVFWSTIPVDKDRLYFRYPDVNEALKFAFDKNPAYCFRLMNNTLPTGCHAWSKKKMYKFWKRIIVS